MSHVFGAYPGITYIGIDKGLSSNDVICIYQDHNGFMWFGTFEGLNKYDGSHFTVYKKAPLDSNTLTDSRIYSITEDHDQMLWVGTRVGVCTFNPLQSKFTPVKYQLPGKKAVVPIVSAVKSLFVLDADKMLIAAEKEGLLLYSKKDKVAQPIALLNGDYGASGYNAISIEADANRNIWVLVRNIGLCKYDKIHHCLRLINGQIKSGNFLKSDKKGDLWIGADEGLYKYSIATNQFTSRLQNNKVLFLNIDAERQLWVGTDGGGLYIMALNTEILKPFNTGNPRLSLSSNAICSIYFDKENRDWIGTIRGGINLFNKKQTLFKTFSAIPNTENTLSNNSVLAFCDAADSCVWVGTDGGGLNFWDRKTGQFFHYRRAENDNPQNKDLAITSILAAEGASIWCATWGKGIVIADKGRGYYGTLNCYNTVTKKEDRFVWKLYKDKTGTIWAATCNDGGLYTYNARTGKFELFDNNLPNIISFGEDKNGNLWCGDFSALIKIDRINKKHTKFDIGYPVRAIFQDSDGNRWIGTEGGGLLLFNEATGSFQRFTEKEGLPSNSVLNIMEDNDKHIWLSSYHGLCRFSILTHKIKNFTASGGLQSNQFSYNAAIKLHYGEMLFGGIKGFNLFSPSLVNSTAPDLSNKQVYLSALKINNIPINGMDKYVTDSSDGSITQLTLPFGTATLSIDFVSPEFSSPDKIQYAYFLQGIDKSWNYVGNTKTASYARLPVGHYVFHVKASNRDGRWGEQSRQIRLIILPPWFETWWAYLLYAGLLLAGIITFNRFRARQRHAKYQVALANLEKEREKEVHEKRLTFFTQISHELRTPLTLIINPLKEVLEAGDTMGDRSDLQIAYRNARRLLRLVDQLLLFRKTESDQDKLLLSAINLTDLAREVFEYFEHQARIKQLDYQFSSAAVHMDVRGDRDKLEIALFNLVSNAIKYTPEGGTVWLTTEEDSDAFYVHVKDSGIGIDPGVGEKIFDNFFQIKSNEGRSFTGFGIGLFITRKFIEQHGGRVYYASIADKGTTFTIRLQKSISATSSSMMDDYQAGTTSMLLQELAPETNDITKTSIGETVNTLKAEEMVSSKQTLLIIEDNKEIRDYIKAIFKADMHVYEAVNGRQGLESAKVNIPDIIISDINMDGLTGIELCRQIKEDLTLRHIPVILLTAVMSQEVKLEGIQSGADDYIVKPFDKELLIARVTNLLKSRNSLQQYYLDRLTLKNNTVKVPIAYQDFLNQCIQIVEQHLEEENFNVKIMAKKMGMSHSSLYSKIKSISGQTVNAFIRSIRLRRAAVLLLSTELNINEVAFQVGLGDLKYFRVQFHKIYGMNPSEYQKRYRMFFNRELNVIKMSDPTAGQNNA